MSYSDLERVHNKVMARLGYPGTPPIAASAADAREPRRRDLEPPKLISGKRYEDFTEDEKRRMWLHKWGSLESMVSMSRMRGG
jgi:hypothetical protein